MRLTFKRRHTVLVAMIFLSCVVNLVRFWETWSRLKIFRFAQRGSLLGEKAADQCLVRSMGCFKALSSMFVPDLMSRSLTPSSCFQYCDATSMLYASLHNGGVCFCGENLLGVARLVESKNCTSDCLGDKNKKCGGPTSAQVFMVLSCKDVYRKMKGCLTRTRRGFTQLRQVQSDRNSCLRICAEKGFTAAAPGRKCSCGHRMNVRPSAKGAFCIRGNVYRTPAPDMICDNKTLLPAGTVPPVALASFPGSGNTWYRQMIETVTGVYSGSVYNEELIFTHGFIGEKLPADSGKTVVVKDHVLHSLEDTKYSSAILLIRNPYDALLAEYNRFRTLGHVSYVCEESLKSKDFHQFVSRKAFVWRNTYSKIICRVPRLLPVYFEDGVQNTLGQIHRILNFLPARAFLHGPDLTKRIKCLEFDLMGKYRRPKRKLTFDPFNVDLKKVINENIATLRVELARVNITSMPMYERHVAKRGSFRDRASLRILPSKIKVKMGK